MPSQSKSYFQGLRDDQRLKHFARELRSDPTQGEKLMWHLLRKQKFMGLRFRSQHPIKPYILDFYCHSLQLGIEVDGPTHYTEEGQASDVIRDKYLNKLGIVIFRVEHDRLLVNTRFVLDELEVFVKNLIEARRQTLTPETQSPVSTCPETPPPAPPL